MMVCEQEQRVMMKNEPRLLGEVIKDLIQHGEILPNFITNGYGKSK